MYHRGMAARTFLGCLVAAAVVLTACGDGKGKANKGASTLDSASCEQLAKACSDDKHVEKLADECTRAGDKLGKRGCTETAATLYGCYEKKLCGKSDKVWTLDDLRVLAERHQVCASEREALRACVAK